jgi:hypothetical protein
VLFSTISETSLSASANGTGTPPAYLLLNLSGAASLEYVYNNSSGTNTANCTLSSNVLSCSVSPLLNASSSSYSLSLLVLDRFGRNATSGISFNVSTTNGNSSNITVSGLSNVTVYINGTPANASTNLSNVQLINVSASQLPVALFLFNFSYSGLNLSSINITNNSTGGASYIEISGILHGGLVGGKNVTIYGASSAYSQVCVLDMPNATASAISSGCNAANETLLTCDGTVSNGKWCNQSSGTISVYNLTYSAVKQFAAAPSSSPQGGTDYITPSLSYSFDCATGELAISAKRYGEPISGLEIRLKDPAQLGYLSSALTGSDGKAYFTITSSGRYSAENALKSGYLQAYIEPFSLALCPVAPQQNETPQQPANQTILPQQNQTQEQIQQEQPQPSASSPNCSSFAYENCPAGCVICPPCEVCSSISCQSEEFCASLGFNRSWYESTKPGTQPLPAANQSQPAPPSQPKKGGIIEKATAQLPLSPETQQAVADAAPPALSLEGICGGALLALAAILAYVLIFRKKKGL